MMVMRKDEAQGIASEALRAIIINPDFNNLKDLISRELDITDEILNDAVKTLFSNPGIVLDAKKYSTWINRHFPEAPDCFKTCKTLWDIPFSFLPEYVFVSGFDVAKKYLPSDCSVIRIADPAAKELNITWINVPGGN